MQTLITEIKFDKLTRDWAMYLDSEYVGSRATPHEARTTLEQLAHDQLLHTMPVREAGVALGLLEAEVR